MEIAYIGKCLYEILEQKEVLVWHTGIYRPISSTATKPVLNALGSKPDFCGNKPPTSHLRYSAANIKPM
jgi:hypothetical protein